MQTNYHLPVLYKEVLDNIVLNRDGVYLDCTMGGGGHTEGILKSISEKGRVVAIDQDEDAICYAKERLKDYDSKLQIFKDNFVNMDIVLYMAGYDKADGILMDIGVSSKQFDNPERGFSYRFDSKLDMRMDKSSVLSAYEVVNEYPEEKLAKIIFEYGEDRFGKKIASEIVRSRQKKKIETTFELVEIIIRAKKTKTLKHPAKQTFQALRIEVNKELEVLEKAIRKAIELLKVGGRLGIITFHSLEDRMVKEIFRELEKGCTCPPQLPICVCNKKPKIKIITKKGIMPEETEIDGNNRAHSSKLRIAERV